MSVAHPDSITIGDCDTVTNGYGDVYAYGNGDSDSHSHSDVYAYGNGNGNGDCDCGAEVYANA